MKALQPYDGLHVTLLTPRRAEEHARRVHNVADHVGLGWKPYTIVIQSYGGVGYKAFHSMRDFRRWLGKAFKVELYEAWHYPGLRSGRIVAK